MLGAIDRPSVAAGVVAAVTAVWVVEGRLARVGVAGLAELVEPVPFLGLLRMDHSAGWIEEVRSVVIPALICAGAAAWALRWRPRLLEPWVLVVNVVLFVVLLHESSYVDISASARVTAGVVLAALFSIPIVSRVIGTRSWFWASGALWLSLMPFWLLAPEAGYFLRLLRSLRHAL